MPRLARVVAQGLPHHITQRGNRRQQTFFCDDDYERYKALMSEWSRKNSVEIWAYCLMPNHIHFIAVPESEQKLNELRCHERTGRPLGNQSFLSRLEENLDRILHKQKPGPKKKQN